MFKLLISNEKIKVFFVIASFVFAFLFIAFRGEYWKAESKKNETLKNQYQAQNIALIEQIQNIQAQANQLKEELNKIQAEQNAKTEELNHALQSNQDWSNSPIPYRVKRLFNNNASDTNKNTDTLPDDSGMQRTGN